MRTFIKNKWTTLREELSSYSSQERIFIFFAMLCGFCICCGYSIIRPVSNSLFIHAFSAKFFPYAWLALVPLNLCMVSFYNRLIPKWGSKKLFFGLLALVISLNGVFALSAKVHPSLSFLFYLWKEVYILLMFQLLWSVIHSNVSFKKAKYLYGIFFGIGGLGSVFGSTFPSFFAVTYGSENLIFLCIPIYLLLGFFYLKMSSYSKGEAIIEEEKKGGFVHGIQLIRSSRFLMFILLIVVFMQMSAALIDFQFNHFLEKTIGDKDLRTEFTGRVFGIIHSLTVALQFIGTYFLIRLIGFKRSHYFVPSVLGISSCLFVFIPIFPIVSLLFVLFKASDFSLFTIIKEMLYIPLKPDEKYRAKAVIDVFAHRSSKAFASLLILALQFAFIEIGSMLTWINIAIAGIWIASVAWGLREYEKIKEAAA